MSDVARADLGFRLETRTAISVVVQALEIAEQRDGAGVLTFKEGRDVVTATDVAVEDAVREHLTREIGLTVVGEERGGQTPADGSPYWLVDPICGTRNFASGNPLYCVNLALVEGGQVTVAVVGDPSTREIAVAERDHGSWALRDGALRRLRVSDESRTIDIGVASATATRRERAASFTAAAIRGDRWDLRNLGTTLSLPYVADGRLSAYIVFWATAVHVAPGSLLVTEAAGVISDIDGEPWSIEADSIVASATTELQQELLSLPREAAPKVD